MRTPDINEGLWLLFTQNESGMTINLKFHEVFGRYPEFIVPEGNWKFAGPVTDEEQDERRAKI